MAKQVINVGTAANDKKGDSLRAAFQKVNANFTELYTELGLVNDVTLSLGAFEFTGSTMTTTDSTAIVIDQATTITSNLSVGGDILPQTANGGDLGSSTLPWRSLYVSNNTIYIGGTAVGVDANGNLTTNGTIVGGGGNVDLQDVTINGSQISSITSIIELKGNSFVQVTGGADLNNLFINDEGAIITVGDPAKHWTFGTDGNLIIPGDIRSEGNINIDINLSDSTLRRWQFGEDGDLRFPDGTVQTTAWVDGGSSIVNTTSLSINDFTTGTYDNKGSVEVTYTPYTGAESGFNFSAEFQSPLDGTKGVTVGAVSTPLIHNDNGINIEINLADSTKRIWSFQEDGDLVFPGGKVSIQASTSSGSIRGSTNTPIIVSSIGSTGSSSLQWVNNAVTPTALSGVIVNGGGNAGDVLILTGTYNPSTGALDKSWTFGTDGNLTFPQGTLLGYSDPGGFIIDGAVDKDIAIYTYNGADAHGWTFGTDGSLTLPGDIRSEGNINIDINLSDSTLRRWQFGEDGHLTLPAGGDIKDSTGTSVLGGGGGSVSSLVNGAYTVSLGSTGTLTVPASGIITTTNNEFFKLQAKDSNSLLRNEIKLDPNNGTYMSVWSEEIETSYNTSDWATGSWNNEDGLGAARFTGAEDLQAFWTAGPGSFVESVEVSINGGARGLAGYEGNNGGGYGVYLSVDQVPPGGQGTTVPITSLVFYYRTKNRIDIDRDGGQLLLNTQYMNINLETNSYINLKSTRENPVRIITNKNTHMWEFDSTGSLTLPREGKIYGIGDGGPGGNRYGYISWDGESSGFNTMRLVPDLQGPEAADTYIILDPEWVDGETGSIHIRAGGTLDNSLAHLCLGGVNSHVKIGAGANPPVTVKANSNSWIFGTDGDLTVPGDIKSTANTSIIIDGGVLFANVTVQTVDSFGGGVWRMFISSSAYPTVGTIVQVGDTATTAWGTPVAVTITSIVQDIGAGTWALHTNQDITTGFFFGPGTQTITINSTQVKTWTFSTDKSLTFPDGTKQTTAAQAFSFSVAADDSTQRAISNNESIKFIGAGTVTTASDAEGNITITGSGGGGSSIPAVVTTGAVGVDGAAHAKVQFTVASATTVTAVGVTAIGVTDSTKGTITLSGSPATGAFDIVAVTNTFPGEFYIFIPFATNAQGTGYGAPISGEGTNPCLVRGTLITMADMSRVAVENITYSDNILVWDFDLGEFASAKPLWIKKTQTTVVSCLLTFSDHSELRIVGDSPKAHRIFNKEAGKFTYGSMPETPIGTTTFNDQGEEITLISKEWIVGEVEFYNVMTDYHMNLFANSILTSMRYNNLYPITDMKFVKDSRTLRTADDYPNVEERLYKGFRLAEQTQSVEEIETHIQWLLTLEVERETECV